MNFNKRHALSLMLTTAISACSKFSDRLDQPLFSVREKWNQFTPGSQRFVDHRPWAFLLERYISQRSDDVHLVSYGDFSSTDKQRLDWYIASLANTAINLLDRKEQYAYWLNLYNALVVRLIVRHYLILSIRDIPTGFSWVGPGPFIQKLITIDGQRISLLDIRNFILRPTFNDPRLHYALCDGAIGSPNLQSRAFTGDRVDRMLDGAALDYVNHPRGVRFEENQLILSSLYDWYANDFGGLKRKTFSHVSAYGTPDLVKKLQSVETIKYQFDWSLNDGTGASLKN